MTPFGGEAVDAALTHSPSVLIESRASIINGKNMKNKRFIMLLALLSAAGFAMGQNKLWEFSETPADTTIVREWKDGKYVVYSRYGATRMVTVHDNQTPTVTSLTIPSVVNISDFRIANDTAFAGGYMLMGSSKRGLLACLDLNKLMAGSGTLHWTIFGPSWMWLDCCAVNNDDIVTEVKRIALYKDGSLTRIAYIASNNITGHGDPTTVNLKRVGFGDAAYTGDPSGPWEINSYHYNKDGAERYTDITCTDNHIVVTAYDTVNRWLHFMVFNRMADFANISCLLPSPPIYYFTDHKIADSSVTVTACGGDIFAVTYNYIDPTSLGIAVRIFSLGTGSPVLTHGIDMPLTPAAGVGMMRDARYNVYGNRLWFLNKVSVPPAGFGGYCIFDVDMGNIYAGNYVARYIVDELFQSMDSYQNDGFIVSGVGQEHFNVFSEYNTGTSADCRATAVFPGYPVSPAMSKFSRHYCVTNPNPSWGSLGYTSYHWDLILRCPTDE